MYFPGRQSSRWLLNCCSCLPYIRYRAVNKHIYRDQLGNQFGLAVWPENFPQGVARVNNWDLLDAMSFVRSLQVSESAWRQLLRRCDRDPVAYTSNELMQTVGAMVHRGALSFYRIPELQQAPAARDGQGWAFTFVSANTAALPAYSHLRTSAQAINSLQDAQALVDSLGMPEDFWQQVVSEHAGADSVPSAAGGAQEQAAKLLADNKLTLYKVPDHKAMPEDPATAEPAESQITPPRQSQSVTESEPVVAQTTEEEECVCYATALSISCGHGRKPNASNVLQIVASPDKTRSEEYEMMGVKITLKEEYAGKDKVKATLALVDDQTASCFEITDIDGAFQEGKQATLAIESPYLDSRSKWPKDASPQTLIIKGRGCDQSELSATIESFPSQYYTVQADVSVFSDWVKKINDGWEKWGKRIFDASPVSLNPKLTGPAGSFGASWGWKEASDWRAYFDVAGNFGVNPILGVEIKLTISFVKLGLTAAGIPPNLSSLAAEHLADLQLSVGAGCKGSLTGSPHGKFYSDGSKEVTGEAKFVIEGNVMMEVLGRIGSDYVISAELSASGETKVSGQDQLELDQTGFYAQTTITMDPFVGTARVKIRYFKVRTKTKEKKWTPWKQIELYKSDKVKLLPRS